MPQAMNTDFRRPPRWSINPISELHHSFRFVSHGGSKCPRNVHSATLAFILRRCPWLSALVISNRSIDQPTTDRASTQTARRHIPIRGVSLSLWHHHRARDFFPQTNNPINPRWRPRVMGGGITRVLVSLLWIRIVDIVSAWGGVTVQWAREIKLFTSN